MPELPEVQTIVDDLNRKIRGYRIVDFWSDWKKSIKTPFARYKKDLIGRKIVKVERRAKNILIYLSSGKIMLVHLKMTGHLLVKISNDKLPSFAKAMEGRQVPNKFQKLKLKYKESDYFNEKVNQYIHHAWFLENGKQRKTLEFSDLRKFGKIELFDTSELEKRKDMRKLGVEPLSKNFTEEKLKEIIKAYPKRNIRMILMDLKLIVGIGNIYASEIPFEAGISPKRKAKRITQKEIRKLYKSIIKVLQKALKMRGTSDSDYRDTAGAKGSFQNVLKVYNREDLHCKRKNCKGIIKREKIGQRSAFWCPKCQG